MENFGTAVWISLVGFSIVFIALGLNYLAVRLLWLFGEKPEPPKAAIDTPVATEPVKQEKEEAPPAQAAPVESTPTASKQETPVAAKSGQPDEQTVAAIMAAIGSYEQERCSSSLR